MNHKEKIKNIIEKLTLKSKSILSEKIFFEACENGIGEQFTSEAMSALIEEEYIQESLPGVIKRIN